MERRPPQPAPPASAGCETARVRDQEGLRTSVVRFGRNLRIARHHHDRACLTVVLGGVFEERFRGPGLRSEAGWVLAKPAGEPHSDCFGRSGSQQVIVEMDEGAFAGGPDLVPGLIRHDRDARALTLAAELARELDLPEDGFTDLAVRGLVLQLLAAHARAARTQAAAPTWIRQVRDLLHERTRHPPSLGELASQAGVHPNHLIRQFSRSYGLSPAAYGRRVRLEGAARALRESDAPIAAIALRSGFSDQSHFTRWFRRHTGTTPAVYRARGGGSG